MTVWYCSLYLNILLIIFWLVLKVDGSTAIWKSLPVDKETEKKRQFCKSADLYLYTMKDTLHVQTKQTYLFLYILTTLGETKTILFTTPSLKEREKERERERERELRQNILTYIQAHSPLLSTRDKSSSYYASLAAVE